MKKLLALLLAAMLLLTGCGKSAKPAEMVTLDVGMLAPLFAFIGVAMVVFLKAPRAHHIGKILFRLLCAHAGEGGRIDEGLQFQGSVAQDAQHQHQDWKGGKHQKIAGAGRVCGDLIDMRHFQQLLAVLTQRPPARTP